jgi:hypothetical protein
MTPSGCTHSIGVDKGRLPMIKFDFGGMMYSVEAETPVSSLGEIDKVAGSHDGFFTMVSNSNIEEKRLGEVDDRINGAPSPDTHSSNDEVSQSLFQCARSYWCTESARGLFFEVEAEVESHVPESAFTETLGVSSSTCRGRHQCFSARGGTSCSLMIPKACCTIGEIAAWKTRSLSGIRARTFARAESDFGSVFDGYGAPSGVFERRNLFCACLLSSPAAGSGGPLDGAQDCS